MDCAATFWSSFLGRTLRPQLQLQQQQQQQQQQLEKSGLSSAL
jgi:hypothetical protein